MKLGSLLIKKDIYKGMDYYLFSNLEWDDNDDYILSDDLEGTDNKYVIYLNDEFGYEKKFDIIKVFCCKKGLIGYTRKVYWEEI